MKKTDKLLSPLTPIQDFFKTESSSGIVLLITTVLGYGLLRSAFNDPNASYD